MPTEMQSTIITCDQCLRSSLKTMPNTMMNKMQVVLVIVYNATVTYAKLHWLKPMSQAAAAATGLTLVK